MSKSRFHFLTILLLSFKKILSHRQRDRDRHTDRQTETDTQTHRHIHRQQTDRQTDKQTANFFLLGIAGHMTGCGDKILCQKQILPLIFQRYFFLPCIAQNQVFQESYSPISYGLFAGYNQAKGNQPVFYRENTLEQSGIPNQEQYLI